MVITHSGHGDHVVGSRDVHPGAKEGPMAAKRLLMRQIREILRLKYEVGLKHRAIAKACSVGYGTVSNYVTRARGAGLTWPLPDDLGDDALEALVFPPPTLGASRAELDYTHIHAELRRSGVTLQLLWIEYRASNPEGCGYSQFCDRYRRWAGRLSPTMRQVHRAGERCFVDFAGKTPTLTDAKTGLTRSVELFVGVLGASSLTYAEATEDQSVESWLAVHQEMLRYFGGSSELWIPDNLKTAVTTPCRYEPIVNRTYAELAQHYGAVVLPTRTRRPRDKAKVETAVQVAERWVLAVLRNRRFFSLQELNDAIRELIDELNNREMKHLGVSRRQLFESIEKKHLRPLPPIAYERADWKRAKVNIDYHIVLERDYYSVPHSLVGEHVDVRFTSTTVEIFHKSKRCALHVRQQAAGQCSTKTEHMPASHRAHLEWTPSRIIDWAHKTGAAASRVVRSILESRRHPEQGYRSCLGLLRLGKKYGQERLEAACSRAMTLQSPSYRTVKNILSNGMDLVLFCEDQTTTTVPQHNNIRGADYYEDKHAQSANSGEDARDEDVGHG